MRFSLLTDQKQADLLLGCLFLNSGRLILCHNAYVIQTQVFFNNIGARISPSEGALQALQASGGSR